MRQEAARLTPTGIECAICQGLGSLINGRHRRILVPIGRIGLGGCGNMTDQAITIAKFPRILPQCRPTPGPTCSSGRSSYANSVGSVCFCRCQHSYRSARSGPLIQCNILARLFLGKASVLPFRDEELAFLRRHRISPDDVYDGRNESKLAWQMGARDNGKTLILGSPCRASGHRLRTRAGHCAQCDPKKITYQRRWRARSYVYIAGSLAAGLIKVGVAADTMHRENVLRRIRYGNVEDWELLAHVEVEEGGRIEYETLMRLGRQRVFKSYQKDGYSQVGGELLLCSFSAALSALLAWVSDDERATLWKWGRSSKYEFDAS
jgi:hypothetical protein